jgi:hypothetical protein
MSAFDENNFLGFDPSDIDALGQNENQRASNPLIYRTRPQDSKSEDGKYHAVIKIIYNPFNPNQSVIEQQSYALEDKNGWFNVVSKLTNGDKSCPIFKAWKRCHFAKKDDSPEEMKLFLQSETKDKNPQGKGLFDKRFARYVLIQVLEDDNQPEQVGKFLFWKCPSSIWNLVTDKTKPTDPKKAKIPVMDYLFGRSIDITVTPGPGNVGDETYNRQTKYTGEISYKAVCCLSPDGSPLLNDEEKAVLKVYVSAMEEVWDSKDPEFRKTKEAEIRADANTVELGKIYSKVLNQMKQWCPNLIDEFGYKEWTPEITTRVQNWIDIVLTGNDPKTYNPNIAATVNNTDAPKTETPKTEAPAVPVANDSDPTDDLPF